MQSIALGYFVQNSKLFSLNHRHDHIKSFLDEDFLLENSTAQELYHDFAKELPIVDYHCHLSPQEIAENKQFKNLTEIWLYGDHYKWRAMRTLGIDERFITGDATDEEKFGAWAKTVPYTIRNPLYHWTHLELKRYFYVDGLLDSNSAAGIYKQANEYLAQPAYTTLGLLKQMNVEVVCSTDDPTDSLRFHQEAKQKDLPVKLFPAFRPDKAIIINRADYTDYIETLSVASGMPIYNFQQLLDALASRIAYFDELGCRLADHGLNKVFAAPFEVEEVDKIFRRKLAGQEIFDGEVVAFQSAIMHFLGKMYAEKGWVMQLHLGAMRNNSSRMLRTLGPDTGFDSIGDYSQANDLAQFLNSLDQEDQLPKTIIYNLNPADNELMATMIGNFNDGSIKGKMQLGSAWWFLDQIDGMEKQMNALSNMGLLSCFIGMLTDSRSFLSFPRHEYFRRILCNLIGKDVHAGLLPNDLSWLGKIVSDICYHNVKEYTGL